MIAQSRISSWPADRLAEARAVVADVACHSDHLVGLVCNVLAAHGETATERKDARVLLLVIDARRPVRRAQREDAARRVMP
jgi:hypothetical protein